MAKIIFKKNTTSKERVPMENNSTAQSILNARGNILVVCVVIIMILTSLGIFAINSTVVELNMASRDRLENTSFQNAEAGMRFALTNFMNIYKNEDDSPNPLPLYTANTAAGSTTGPAFGGIVTFNIVGGRAILTASQTPPGNPVSLQLMDLSTSAVAFQYNNQNNIPVALIEVVAIMRFPATSPTDPTVTVPTVRDIIVPADNRAGSVAGTFQLFTPNALDIPSRLHIGLPPRNFDDSYKGRCYMITSTALTNTGELAGSPVQVGVTVAITNEQAKDLIGK